MEYRVRSAHENNCSYHNTVHLIRMNTCSCALSRFRTPTLTKMGCAATTSHCCNRHGPNRYTTESGGKWKPYKRAPLFISKARFHAVSHVLEPRFFPYSDSSKYVQLDPCPQFHLSWFQLPIVSYRTKLLSGKLKTKQFTSFKLCLILSSTLKSHTILLSWSNRPLVRHIQ